MPFSNHRKSIIRGANWTDIRSDRQKGLNYTETARKYNIDPRTAKKYAPSETRPVYRLSATKPPKLDPYKEQIAVWLEEAPYSAERIPEKIQEQGFEGGHSMVRGYVRNKKEQLDAKATVSRPPRTGPIISKFTEKPPQAAYDAAANLTPGLPRSRAARTPAAMRSGTMITRNRHAGQKALWNIFSSNGRPVR